MAKVSIKSERTIFLDGFLIFFEESDSYYNSAVLSRNNGTFSMQQI